MSSTVSWGELRDVLEIKPFESINRPKFPEDWERKWSPFTAEWWTTVALLEKEIGFLAPKRAILEVDIRPDQLRNDGMLRSGVTPAQPGVRLTLIGTPHGDLRYPCGTFRHMEDNIRAIGLSLEALRKVDRYGVVKDGQQYRGFAQLEAPRGDGDIPNGRRLIAAAGGNIKEAKRRAHPDNGGNADDFVDIQAAEAAAA